MIGIWKADTYRLTKSKAFYLYWIIIIFTYAISIASKMPGGINTGAAMLTDNDLKLDLQQVSANFTFFYLFLFPVFGFICCDFGEKTIKNTISSAISRKSYFIAKFIYTEIYTLGTFLLSNLLFYEVNKLINGKKYSSGFGEYARAVAIQLPLFAGAVAVLVLIAFLVKRTAAFNAITMITPLLYTSVALAVYSAGAEKFAMKYMLKFELSTALNQVVTVGGSTYIAQCSAIGIGAFVLSFVLGYLTFQKFELNS